MQAENQDNERELAWQTPQSISQAVNELKKAAGQGKPLEAATALQALVVVAQTHIGRVDIRATAGIEPTVKMLAASW
jgi:hypothetical protein